MKSYEVKFPSLEKLINEVFHDVFFCEDRYLLLNGSRDSGKSVTARRKVIYIMLTSKYCRGILIRKIKDTVKDSMYQGIKDDIYKFGLQDLFIFRKSPLEIECLNGNIIVARGLDEPEKIKSFTDPSLIWYEEATDMTYNDFITVTTSVRSNEAEYLQEIFTFNNEVNEPDYRDNWMFKTFFEKHYPVKNFSDIIEIEIENKIVQLPYTVKHSTYKDNPYCSKERSAIYENMKNSDPYKYQIYALGEWANKEIGGLFYKNFQINKHVGKCELNKDLSLHVSFDENVKPYPAFTIYQINGKKVKQIHEICLFEPNNKLKSVVREFVSWMRQNEYFNKIFLYGDVTSIKEDAKQEKGINYFTMMQRDIASEGYNCEIRRSLSNPSVGMRGEFINAILLDNYDGIEFMIDENCKISINDFLNVQEAEDGKKLKRKNKDGYEPIGHTSDTTDYLLCEVFKNSFTRYKEGGRRNINKTEHNYMRGYSNKILSKNSY